MTISGEHEARAAAERYRIDHHLGSQPLGDLVALIDLIEKIDVAIIRSPASDTHGITICDPQTDTVMLIATATPNPVRLRSTIAHELAHHLFNDKTLEGNDWKDRPFEEVRADAFARHLLLPLAAIPEMLGPLGPSLPTGESDVSGLVQRFALSPQMVAIQLCEAGYISAQQKNQWMTLTAPQLSTRYGWGNLYAMWQSDSQTVRPPQRLLARAIRGYADGLVSIGTIARLQDTDPDTAFTELTEAGVLVQQPEATTVDETELLGAGASDALAAFDAEFGDDG